MCVFFLFYFIESLYNAETSPKKKIEDLIHLAELCIDLLQQNEEHHTEVSIEQICSNSILKISLITRL